MVAKCTGAANVVLPKCLSKELPLLGNSRREHYENKEERKVAHRLDDTISHFPEKKGWQQRGIR